MVIPVLRWLRLEGLQLEASLGYIDRLCLIKKKKHKPKQTMILIDGYSLVWGGAGGSKARRGQFSSDHKTDLPPIKTHTLSP